MSRKIPDFDLWTEVARSVKPLRHKAPRKAAPKTKTESPKPLPSISAPHIHVPQSVPVAPPLTGFDRRTAQRLSRGNVEIDARLDLHGTGLEMARVQLLQFLAGAHAHGLRTVLVITGKGDSPYARHTLHGAGLFHSPERQGRLRRMVPEWLQEAEFRRLISGFQPAHPRHGGGGAFYLKIRRKRERA